MHGEPKQQRETREEESKPRIRKHKGEAGQGRAGRGPGQRNSAINKMSPTTKFGPNARAICRTAQNRGRGSGSSGM